VTSHRRHRTLALLSLVLAITALVPAIGRGWPLILQGAPIWLSMLLQTLVAIAAAILFAGALALFISWWRKIRREGTIDR
jgi:hypothetical protein